MLHGFFQDEKCHFNKETVGATDVGYVQVEQGNEDKLKEAVATIGPIAIGIDASDGFFQSYTSGM